MAAAFTSTVYLGLLQAGGSINAGALAMLAGGDIVPAGDPTPYALTLSGVDANGDIAIFATESDVRVAIVDPMANNQKLALSITWGATLDITVSQSTDGMGALTGTANQICELVRGHAVASQWVQLAPTGTGASVTSAVAATAVPKITVLGFAQELYDNPGPAPLALDMFFSRDFFYVGNGVATASQMGDLVGLLDDAPTLRAPPQPLDLLAVFTGIDAAGNVFCRFPR